MPSPSARLLQTLKLKQQNKAAATHVYIESKELILLGCMCVCAVLLHNRFSFCYQQPVAAAVVWKGAFPLSLVALARDRAATALSE